MSVALTTAQALTLWHHVALAMVKDDEPDLSVRQMSILLTVYLEAPPHTVRDLASKLGVTKPVVLDAQFTGAGTNPMSRKATIGFHGSTTLKRSDWGMTKFVPFISDDVKINISIAFEK